MLTPAYAQSATLATIDSSMVGGYSTPPQANEEIRFTFDFGGALHNLEFGGTVFDLLLSSADTGKVFSVNSGAEFEEAVGFLTNGVNDWITYQFDGGGAGWTEGGFFYGDVDGANGIDLAGSQIDSINLHINNLQINKLSSPADSWEWYSYNLDAFVSIEGTPAIPEPTTAIYMMIGLTVITLALRRQSSP